MIEKVETLLLDVPAIRPHKLSVATVNVQTLVLVRILCDDGTEGWGEATTIGGLSYGEESPESIKINIDTYMAPLLVGMEESRTAVIMARLNKVIQGNRFAKCALETALLDARARQLNITARRAGQGGAAGGVDSGQRRHAEGYRRSQPHAGPGPSPHF